MCSAGLGNEALLVELPELRTLLLGSLGRFRPTRASTDSGRVEVSGQVKEVVRELERQQTADDQLLSLQWGVAF